MWGSQEKKLGQKVNVKYFRVDPYTLGNRIPRVFQNLSDLHVRCHREKFYIEFLSQFFFGSHYTCGQGCISCETCSYPELTEDHVLTSAYFKIFRIVTRNAVNKSFWRKKDCSWPPLNKYAMNIWLSSLKIRAHLSWRTGKHLHVLHVLRTCSTCSYPGYQDTATYAALVRLIFSQGKPVLLRWSYISSQGRIFGHMWCEVKLKLIPLHYVQFVKYIFPRNRTTSN